MGSRSKLKFWIFAFTLLAVALIYRNWMAVQSPGDSGSPVSAPIESVSPEKQPSPLASPIAATPSPTPSAEPAARALTPLSLPTREDLRKEVGEDPHATPKSLLVFAVQMSERMEPALKSESAAMTFFPELEDCALDPKQIRPRSVVALCLTNAQLLEKRYPALSEGYSRLLEKANPDAVELMNRGK